MSRAAGKYHYCVEWSEEDRQFVGTCVEFPSLSQLADTMPAALEGIVLLIADVLEEADTRGEDVPDPWTGSFEQVAKVVEVAQRVRDGRYSIRNKLDGRDRELFDWLDLAVDALRYGS